MAHANAAGSNAGEHMHPIEAAKAINRPCFHQPTGPFGCFFRGLE